MSEGIESHKSANSPLGLKTYLQYCALKAHFNSTYNWKRHKGAIKANEQSFLKRHDKLFFELLETRYSASERNQIFIANFIYNKHIWVGDLLSEECIGYWHNWRGRISGIDYQFEEDIKNALLEIQLRKGLAGKEALKYLIQKPDHTHPLVLRFVWGGMFGIESYMILSQVMNLKKVYADVASKDDLWSDFEHKLHKYGLFLQSKLNVETNKQKLRLMVMESQNG